MSPFALLHLTRDASAEEIKRAYRRLAMQWHPDRNPTREAEEHFKQIKAAYELLLDPERLAAWESASAGDAQCGAATAPSHELTLQLGLEEAAAGCFKKLVLATERRCVTCAGTGNIEHRSSVACHVCQGVGRVRAGRSNATCAACAGKGYMRVTACQDCHGSGWQEAVREIEVRIPAGMLPGERLRLSRQHQPREGQTADLLVKLDFEPHPLFTLEGRDLLCSMPVSIFRLLHGGAIAVPTLSGMQEIDIQSYPEHGLEYSLPGLGYPGRHGRHVGRLRLSLRPVFPQHLADAERKLLLRLEKAMLHDPSHHAPELAAWERACRKSGL